MAQSQRGRNYWFLVVLILLAMLYASFSYFRLPLTGRNKTDGIIGALLGLYICSQGAANILDLIIYGGTSVYQALTRRSLLSWVAFNIFILFVGWVVIVLGTTRFTAPF